MLSRAWIEALSDSSDKGANRRVETRVESVLGVETRDEGHVEAREVAGIGAIAGTIAGVVAGVVAPIEPISLQVIVVSGDECNAKVQ